MEDDKKLSAALKADRERFDRGEPTTYKSIYHGAAPKNLTLEEYVVYADSATPGERDVFYFSTEHKAEQYKAKLQKEDPRRYVEVEYNNNQSPNSAYERERRVAPTVGLGERVLRNLGRRVRIAQADVTEGVVGRASRLAGRASKWIEETSAPSARKKPKVKALPAEKKAPKKREPRPAPRESTKEHPLSAAEVFRLVGIRGNRKGKR